MPSFNHSSVVGSSLAPPTSPISHQGGDLTPSSLYPCHMNLRPPPHHHLVTNDGVPQSVNLVDSRSNCTGSSGGYEALSAYALPPPPPIPSSSSASSSNFSGGSPSSTTTAAAVSSAHHHHSMESRQSPSCGSNSNHLGIGHSSVFATDSISPTVSPYMSYNYAAAAASASSNVNGVATPVSGGNVSSGKQQFFASCFYSPWV